MGWRLSIDQTMEIHQLKYFCAVAKTGNFTRAAAQEHVAQPSLSQQVQKMEHELGAKLFDRLGRGVRLTAFGQTFLPRAQAILRELSEATSEIHQMAGSESGTIVFGSIPTIAPYFLPRRVSQFLKRHPQVRLQMVEEITRASDSFAGRNDGHGTGGITGPGGGICLQRNPERAHVPGGAEYAPVDARKIRRAERRRGGPVLVAEGRALFPRVGDLRVSEIANEIERSV